MKTKEILQNLIQAIESNVNYIQESEINPEMSGSMPVIPLQYISEELEIAKYRLNDTECLALHTDGTVEVVLRGTYDECEKASNLLMKSKINDGKDVLDTDIRKLFFDESGQIIRNSN